MKFAYLFAALSLAVSQMACSQSNSKPADCRSNTLPHAQHFNQIYQKDEFYIFYSTVANSPHRLKNLQDQNKNGTPDYIEDIATQAVASRDIFKAAGFRHPLQSPRYQHVQGISIFVQNLKGNGVAYEVPASHPNLKHRMPCSLVLQISTNLTDFPANYWTTVTHELFHLYQYSYSQFKNTWYLESLANWSERALRIDLVGSTKNLPALPSNSQGVKNEIFNQGYHRLWKRLSVIEGQDRLVVAPSLQKMRYVDGSHVFKDHEWRNTTLVLNVMQNLEQSSLNISQQKKWNPYHWQENDQRLAQWNPIIWQDIQAALKKQNYKTQEVKQLQQLHITP